MNLNQMHKKETDWKNLTNQNYHACLKLDADNEKKTTFLVYSLNHKELKIDKDKDSTSNAYMFVHYVSVIFEQIKYFTDEEKDTQLDIECHILKMQLSKIQ